MESSLTNSSAGGTGISKRSLPDLFRWTAWGTLFQIAMVFAGHYNEFIKTNVFAIGGMGISLVFGALYGKAIARSKGEAVLGGSIVGGACAFVGIAVSFLMGDVEALILAFGTAGSAVAGLLGGIVLYAISGTRSRH